MHELTAYQAWHTTRFEIDLSKPKVMGIVNVTPDSFATRTMTSERSAHSAKHWIQNSIDHAACQVQEGAHVLDIGAESSRPGAATVGMEDEWSRLQPILKELMTW